MLNFICKTKSCKISMQYVWVKSTFIHQFEWFQENEDLRLGIEMFNPFRGIDINNGFFLENVA